VAIVPGKSGAKRPQVPAYPAAVAVVEAVVGAGAGLATAPVAGLEAAGTPVVEGEAGVESWPGTVGDTDDPSAVVAASLTTARFALSPGVERSAPGATAAALRIGSAAGNPARAGKSPAPAANTTPNPIDRRRQLTDLLPSQSS
jgi:hypothetical protein